MSKKLSLWSVENCAIHPFKSTLMILSPKRFTDPLPDITLGGVPFA